MELHLHARPLSAVVPLLLLTGTAHADVAVTRQPLVYDDDERTDVLLHPDPDLRELALGSTVAIVDRRKVHMGRPVRLDGPLLEDTEAWCEPDRFAKQPVIADCSGVLVDDDLVLTAGHCVDSAAQCAGLDFVFDLVANGDRVDSVDPEDVFGCAELVSRELGDMGAATVHDHALVRLDRPARGRAPVPVAPAASERGDAVTLIGHGLGLPMKIDDGGRITDARPLDRDYFVALADNFHRGSGSGAFDVEGRLVGIAVRGGIDLIQEGEGSQQCVRVRAVSEGHGLGEHFSYAATALQMAGFGDLVDESPAPAPPTRGCIAALPSHGAPAGSWLALLIPFLRRTLCRKQQRTKTP